MQRGQQLCEWWGRAEAASRKLYPCSGKAPLSIVIVRPPGPPAKFQRDNTQREMVHYRKPSNARKDITRGKPVRNKGLLASWPGGLAAGNRQGPGLALIPRVAPAGSTYSFHP